MRLSPTAGREHCRKENLPNGKQMNGQSQGHRGGQGGCPYNFLSGNLGAENGYDAKHT